MRQCKLHNVELKFGKREIRRGFPPAPPEGFFEAEEALFPNAKSFEIGGCSVSLDDVNEKRVYFCPECRNAESDWHAGRDAEEFWRP